MGSVKTGKSDEQVWLWWIPQITWSSGSAAARWCWAASFQIFQSGTDMQSGFSPRRKPCTWRVSGWNIMKIQDDTVVYLTTSFPVADLPQIWVTQSFSDSELKDDGLSSGFPSCSTEASIDADWLRGLCRTKSNMIWVGYEGWISQLHLDWWLAYW